MKAGPRGNPSAAGKASPAQTEPGKKALSSVSVPWFAILLGLFFFLVIIKLGDPVVIRATNLPPRNLDDALYGSWPPAWGRWALLPLAIVGFATAPWRQIRFQPILLFPLAWLLWQFVSAACSVDATLTALTIPHLVACVVLYYLGYCNLNGVRWPWPILVGLALGLCWEMRSAVEQHFGGLAATRSYLHSVYGNQWPELVAQMPEFAKRIASGRVFASFVSPNALAAAELFFVPLTLVLVWQLTPKVRLSGRIAFVSILGGCALAVLYWSGSKAGWLLAILMILVVLAHSNLPRAWRRGVIALFLVAGLAAFAIRFNHYFERGATSVSARFDYWKAATETIVHHPLVGTGPGTFTRPYAELKNPQSEMTKLCHNDYLEQGSDSGLPAMFAYTFFIFYSVYRLYRYRLSPNWGKEPLISAVILGVMAIALHSFVEYHLYLPALAWPFFFLLGWLHSLE